MALEDLLGTFEGRLEGWGKTRALASLKARMSSSQQHVLPTVPPQLLVAEGVGQVTAIVGQSLDLPCQASGSPVPTIQYVWNWTGRAIGCVGCEEGDVCVSHSCS